MAKRKTKGVVVETTSVGVTKPKKKKFRRAAKALILGCDVAGETPVEPTPPPLEDIKDAEVKKPLPLWAIVLSSVIIAVGIAVVVRLLAAIVSRIFP